MVNIKWWILGFVLFGCWVGCISDLEDCEFDDLDDEEDCQEVYNERYSQNVSSKCEFD